MHDRGLGVGSTVKGHPLHSSSVHLLGSGLRVAGSRIEGHTLDYTSWACISGHRRLLYESTVPVRRLSWRFWEASAAEACRDAQS